MTPTVVAAVVEQNLRKPEIADAITMKCALWWRRVLRKTW